MLTVRTERKERQRIQSLPAVTIGTGNTPILGEHVGVGRRTLYASPANTEGVFYALANKGVAVINSGPPLMPGGMLVIDDSYYWDGEIHGICASGGQTIYLEETE